MEKINKILSLINVLNEQDISNIVSCVFEHETHFDNDKNIVINLHMKKWEEKAILITHRMLLK